MSSKTCRKIDKFGSALRAHLEAVSVGAGTHADSLTKKSGERAVIAVSDLSGNLLDAVRTGVEKCSRSLQAQILKIGQRRLVEHGAKVPDKGSVTDGKHIREV